jgi:GPH family glycoside/pentoside/hexuronide:cation symporter
MELMLPAVIIAPLSLPLWIALLKRFDRHRMTAVAFAVYALLMPLPWFIAPGPDSVLPMAILFAASSVFVPLLMVTMPTMLGDVIDYDELQTGKNRSGQYNAFLTLVAKGTGAVGGPIALAVLGWFGFQPGSATNSESAVTALRIIYNVLPTLLVIPAVLLVWFFPIDAKRQREIHAQLQARAEQRANGGAAAQAPFIESNGHPAAQPLAAP